MKLRNCNLNEQLQRISAILKSNDIWQWQCISLVVFTERLYYLEYKSLNLICLSLTRFFLFSFVLSLSIMLHLQNLFQFSWILRHVLIITCETSVFIRVCQCHSNRMSRILDRHLNICHIEMFSCIDSSVDSSNMGKHTITRRVFSSHKCQTIIFSRYRF